jgi:hypothetical protein
MGGGGSGSGVTARRKLTQCNIALIRYHFKDMPPFDLNIQLKE